MGEGKTAFPPDNTGNSSGSSRWRSWRGAVRKGLRGGRSTPETPPAPQASLKSPASLPSNPEGVDGWGGWGERAVSGSQGLGREGQSCLPPPPATHLRSRAHPATPGLFPARGDWVGRGASSRLRRSPSAAAAPTRRLWSRHRGRPGSRLRGRAT